MTRNFLKGVTAVVASFWMVGCSSLSFDAPAPLIYPPLVTGKAWKLGGGISGRPDTSIPVSSDASARPPSTTGSTSPSTSGLFPFYVSTGIADRVDVRVEMDFFTSGLYTTARWQLAGDTLETSKAGNLPFTVFASYIGTASSKSGDQKGVYGPGGYPWSAKANNVGTSVGASFGNQLSENFLLFLGAARAWYNATYTITQSRSTDGSDSGGSYSGTQGGSANSAAIGFTWGKKVSLTAMLQAWQTFWTGQPDYSDARGSFSIDFVF